MTPAPSRPKIYHIVHVDRLASIVADKYLWCDAIAIQRQSGGTTIGMSNIKSRRLELSLTSRPGLMVGGCVPFYFCPRSIMLYLIYRGNHENLRYRGGEGPIVHLEADMLDAIGWAGYNNRRWAFTLSNAASNYFSDRCDITQINEINWDAVQATQWTAPAIRESKQAEFLLEQSFPWHLIGRIGVRSMEMVHLVSDAMRGAEHRPRIEVKREWYYG